MQWGAAAPVAPGPSGQRTLFVGSGKDTWFNEESKLREHFGRFGGIESVRCTVEKGFATVRFLRPVRFHAGRGILPRRITTVLAVLSTRVGTAGEKLISLNGEACRVLLLLL